MTKKSKKSKSKKSTYEQTKTKMLRRYKKLKFTEEIPKRKKSTGNKVMARLQKLKIKVIKKNGS